MRGWQKRPNCAQMVSFVLKTDSSEYIAQGQTFCHPGTHLHTIFVFSDAFDKQTFDIIGCKAWILKAFKEHILKLRCINNIQAI
jgi:hypothetical protein